MDMATLQFFQNKFRYPKYTSALISYGPSMDCTPVGMGLRGGTIRVKGDTSYFMSCNYLSIVRDGKTLYGWIDDVKVLNDSVFEVTYTVDAWRTFRSKIDLGVQFIRRTYTETFLRDNLLGGIQPYHDISSTSYVIGSTTQRVAVVQVRKDDGASVFSNTPVQPTPYQFYLTAYNINSWQDSQPLSDLMSALPGSAATDNIVTIYSIPYIDISGLPSGPLIITIENQSPITISGWKAVGDTTDMSGLLTHETPLVIDDVNGLMQVGHTLQVVIPEAGILNIPDEILGKGQVSVRQDIDLFSGACNYMLTTGSNATGDYNIYGQSVRGSSVASIPILSNPDDTYISQNQNALTTSLIGDVANIGMGFGIAALSPDPGMKAWGMSSVVTGGVGIMENWAQRQDGGGVNVNPPAFLGTALAANFNGTFWLVKTVQHVTNADVVHAEFGYPYNAIGYLTFPSSGYIETQSCNVESTDGSVPRWALEEINMLFDNGILVK
jgi:hypothetical protein